MAHLVRERARSGHSAQLHKRAEEKCEEIPEGRQVLRKQRAQKKRDAQAELRKLKAEYGEDYKLSDEGKKLLETPVETSDSDFNSDVVSEDSDFPPVDRSQRLPPIRYKRRKVQRGGGVLGSALGWLAGKVGWGGVVTPAAAAYVGHRTENLLTGDDAADMLQTSKRNVSKLRRIHAGPQHTQGSHRDTWHMSEEGKSKSVLRSLGITPRGKTKRTGIEGTSNPEDTLMVATSRSTNERKEPVQIKKLTHVKEHKPVLAPHDTANYEQALRHLSKHGQTKLTKWSQRRKMAGNFGRFTNALEMVGLGKPSVHPRSRAIKKQRIPKKDYDW